MLRTGQWEKSYIDQYRQADLLKMFHRVKYSGYKRAERFVARLEDNGWKSPVQHPELFSCREIFFNAYPGQVWLWEEFLRFLYHKKSLLVPNFHW